MFAGRRSRGMSARAQFRKQRDDDLQALLTAEQKAAYAKIVEHYNMEVAALNHDQDAEFEAAAERTKKILNDHQRAIYEDMLKKGFRGGPGGPRDGRPGGPAGTRGDRGRGSDRNGDRGGFGDRMRSGPGTTSQP